MLKMFGEVVVNTNQLWKIAVEHNADMHFGYAVVATSVAGQEEVLEVFETDTDAIAYMEKAVFEIGHGM